VGSQTYRLNVCLQWISYVVMDLLRPGYTALLIGGNKLLVPLKEELGSVGVRHAAEIQKTQIPNY